MSTKQISAITLLRRLGNLTRQFGPEYVTAKTDLLRDLSRIALKRPEQLLTYHDALCFMRAYPDSPEVERLTERELRRFVTRIAAFRKAASLTQFEKLTDSGVVGTLTRHPFGYEVTELLRKRHGFKIKLDWDETPDTWESKLFDLLPHLVAWQENDAIDNDDDFDLETFLKRARGKHIRDDLVVLLQLIGGSTIPLALKRHSYESLDLQLKFDLTSSAASRTLCRFPSPKSFYFRVPLKGRSSNLIDLMKRPVSRIVKLSESQGREVIARTCEVLAVRNRELYPVTLANPEEIYRIEPGRGLQVLLFATPPAIRLPLEANFGAMFARNGVPIGYGIAATLFDRVEIAINVFPAFRAGESAYIIEQFFRVFYHHFGSRVFLVRSMQMGNDEEEALRSGAFWFYYKLGFRAISKDVRRLADIEFRKQKSRKGYRTPLVTQKKLAVSDVVLLAHENPPKSWREPSLAKLGYVVTDYFARKHGGDRSNGKIAAVQAVANSLGIRSLSAWSAADLQSLTKLAPLLVNIKDLSKWKREEKQALTSIIRVKGSGLEREYALQCLRHRRFAEAIEKLAGVKRT